MNQNNKQRRIAVKKAKTAFSNSRKFTSNKFHLASQLYGADHIRSTNCLIRFNFSWL